MYRMHDGRQVDYVGRITGRGTHRPVDPADSFTARAPGGLLDNHLFAGRTNFQAPEVDGISYISTEQSPFKLKIGSFADMRVTDAMEYDLMGVAV